jgi:hypothetical protein
LPISLLDLCRVFVSKPYDFSIETLPVCVLSIEFVSLSTSKSSPNSFCFFTWRIYELHAGIKVSWYQEHQKT